MHARPHCRFEFMEGLIRAAFGKYIAPKVTDDASDAVRMLLQHLRDHMPPPAQLDPDAFIQQCAQ